MERKLFKYVQIGDIAYHSDSNGEKEARLGVVLFKGSLSDVENSKYSHTLMDWEDIIEEYREKYYQWDWVVVKEDKSYWGPTLFNYDYDPCGCICFNG